jgi:hypothetical protein
MELVPFSSPKLGYIKTAATSSIMNIMYIYIYIPVYFIYVVGIMISIFVGKYLSFNVMAFSCVINSVFICKLTAQSDRVV